MRTCTREAMENHTWQAQITIACEPHTTTCFPAMDQKHMNELSKCHSFAHKPAHSSLGYDMHPIVSSVRGILHHINAQTMQCRLMSVRMALVCLIINTGNLVWAYRVAEGALSDAMLQGCLHCGRQHRHKLMETIHHLLQLLRVLQLHLYHIHNTR